MRVVAFFLVIAKLSVAAANASADEGYPTCANVEECIKKLRAASLEPHASEEINGRESVLADLLAPLGPSAVQALIPLLDDQNRRTAAAAAFALAKFGLLARPAIPVLARSLLRGNGWASFALSNTKDAKAIPPLVASALAGEPTAAPALMRMGPAGQRAAASMLAKNTHVRKIEQEFLSGAVSVKSDKSALIGTLTDVAKNRTLPRANHLLACEALWRLGKVGPDKLPACGTWAHSEDLILALGPTTTVRRPNAPTAQDLIARLKRATPTDAIDLVPSLGELGGNGRDATLVLVARAKGATWDDQIKLVVVLGVLGDARAVPFLIDELNSASWRVVTVAVLALGRLGGAARPALPALDALQRTHWLPSVREHVLDTKASIARGRPTVVTWSNGMTVLWDPGWLKPRAVKGLCGAVGGAGWNGAEDLNVKEPADLADVEERMRGHVVKYAVDGGLLIGTNRRNGDGEVVWTKSGREEKVARGNVVAIVPRPWGLVLLQGTEYVSGTASILSQGSSGHWTARPFLELPGAPYKFRTPPDGGMVIATMDGIVTLDNTGAVKRFECEEQPQGLAFPAD